MFFEFCLFTHRTVWTWRTNEYLLAFNKVCNLSKHAENVKIYETNLNFKLNSCIESKELQSRKSKWFSCFFSESTKSFASWDIKRILQMNLTLEWRVYVFICYTLHCTQNLANNRLDKRNFPSVLFLQQPFLCKDFFCFSLLFELVFSSQPLISNCSWASTVDFVTCTAALQKLYKCYCVDSDITCTDYFWECIPGCREVNWTCHVVNCIPVVK